MSLYRAFMCALNSRGQRREGSGPSSPSHDGNNYCERLICCMIISLQIPCWVLFSVFTSSNSAPRSVRYLFVALSLLSKVSLLGSTRCCCRKDAPRMRRRLLILSTVTLLFSVVCSMFLGLVFDFPAGLIDSVLMCYWVKKSWDRHIRR